MHLVRLTYVSRLARDCGADELGRIMTVSRRNNRNLGVTGALCYSPRGFLQILEGPAGTVNELYRRIVQDRRHVDCTLVEYTPIHQRDFEHWSMAYIRADEIDTALLRKYTTRQAFDPFEMMPGQARAFLQAVAKERAEFLARQQAAVRKRKA
ncbi:MAG: BLUF domain-containing protein [Kiritimatiellae bacterium]|nr:BLUF domain-containing protein [Kiritimatiellia bacterium]